MSDQIENRIDTAISSINSQISTISDSIETKYNELLADTVKQLNDYKAEIGQYMYFGEDGLMLGASTSQFKTIIDNAGVYFKQGDMIVSYVNNNQLALLLSGETK